MNRFTIREYSDFGIEPQDQTRILFESDNLSDVKEYIKDYFAYESYFNAVYFMDNKLNKQGYVGRDLTINCGESLSDFCEIQENKGLEALKRIGGFTITMSYLNKDGAISHLLEIKDECREDYKTIETELKRLKELEKENDLLKSLIKVYEASEKNGDEILRIIKEKKVEVNILEDCKTCKEYNDFIKHRVWFQEEYVLTQAEFDLLKEWLNEKED